MAIRMAFGEDPARHRYGPDVERHVLRWDMHDRERPAGGRESSIQELAPASVSGPGYQWYELGTWALSESNFLWIYHVNLEVALRDALDPLHPGKAFTLWARVKFEGPAFPHGATDRENAIFVERVVAVASE